MKNTTIPSHYTGSRIGQPIIGYNIICRYAALDQVVDPPMVTSQQAYSFFVAATHPAENVGTLCELSHFWLGIRHSPMARVSFESRKQPAASNQFWMSCKQNHLVETDHQKKPSIKLPLVLTTNSAKNSPCYTCRYTHPLLATQPRHEVLAHVVVDSLLLPIDLTPFRWPQWHDGWVVSHIPGTSDARVCAQNPCFR